MSGVPRRRNFQSRRGCQSRIQPDAEEECVEAADDKKSKAMLVRPIDSLLYVRDGKNTKVLWNQLNQLLHDSSFKRRIINNNSF